MKNLNSLEVLSVGLRATDHEHASQEIPTIHRAMQMGILTKYSHI